MIQDMTCEKYQSLPPDEWCPEDQLLIELAKVFLCPHTLEDEAKLTHSSPKSGADALGVEQSWSETRGVTT